MDYVLLNFLEKNLNWNINLVSKISPVGGLNNKNYKVYYNDIPYFVRLCDISTLNINRQNELNIINNVSPLKLCPPTIYFNIYSGNMVCKWINGKMPTEIEFNSIDFLYNLSAKLKKLHKLNCNNTFDPFNEIRHRLNICKTLNIKLPSYIHHLTNKLYSLEVELSKNKNIGLCHNDLNVSNIMIDSKNLYIIDYEFSGFGDIFFDLATIAWLQTYEGRINLLTSYFGYFLPEDYEKLLKYLYVVKFFNALWSLIKSSNTDSDYDYKEGANIIFEELINYI